MTSPVQIFPQCGVEENLDPQVDPEDRCPACGKKEEFCPNCSLLSEVMTEFRCQSCREWVSNICPICGGCSDCCGVSRVEDIEFRCLGCNNTPENCTCSEEDYTCQQCGEPYPPGHNLYCETCLGDTW